MAPLHVATLTVQRELPKYEIIFGSLNETMVPPHVATLRELHNYIIMRCDLYIIIFYISISFCESGKSDLPSSIDRGQSRNDNRL